MDLKRILVSLVVLVILGLGEYALYNWGVLTLSELGLLAGGVLLSIAGVILGWLWRREDVVRWWKARKDSHQSSSILPIDNKKENGGKTQDETKELEKLIKPLYLSLDSNRDNPINGAHLAFSEIKQYGNLAQPELRKLLHLYCEIREENPNPEDRAPSYQWKHQERLTDTIKQIDVLVKKRYAELMWGKKES